MEQQPLAIRLLDATDVATLLGISLRKLWHMTANGELPPPIRIGKRSTRWKATDIGAFIDNLSSRKDTHATI
jgi:predicted DNA-binding transcriptional regulator AlpA